LETRTALAPYECRYLATFGQPARLVEVRILSLELARHGLSPEDAEERLANLRGITHPYLPRVAHSGVRDGFAFYVVDPSASRSLGEYLQDQRKGKIDPERAFDMLLPVGQAVSTLHQHGLVHGDVSPRSIRVEEATERTFLATYPIANVLGIAIPAPPFRELRETRSGGALLDGDQATKADDIRGFASVLYQSLTGTPVGPGALPPPASAKCPLPSEADDILQKALDPSPAQRTGSLTEVLEGLGPLKAAIAEVAQAARGGRSRALSAPDTDRRAGKERRQKGRRQEDLDSLPFMDKLAVWLFDKGPAVNFLVFALIAFASDRLRLLSQLPPRPPARGVHDRRVPVPGRLHRQREVRRGEDPGGPGRGRGPRRLQGDPPRGVRGPRALRRFVKAIRKEDREKVLDANSAARIRLTYSENRKKACAMLDIHLKRAHEYLLAQENAKTEKGPEG
jgi:hypothetical protein